jgi:hypothetical protein
MRAFEVFMGRLLRWLVTGLMVAAKVFGVCRRRGRGGVGDVRQAGR